MRVDDEIVSELAERPRLPQYSPPFVRSLALDLREARATVAELREALEDMCHQFAYDGDGPVLYTGGLSALEGAFTALGWDDPHLIPAAQCDEPGCTRRVTCGWPSGAGYRQTCSELGREAWAKGTQGGEK
jgi:hypothetical protein